MKKVVSTWTAYGYFQKHWISQICHHCRVKTSTVFHSFNYVLIILLNGITVYQVSLKTNIALYFRLFYKGNTLTFLLVISILWYLTINYSSSLNGLLTQKPWGGEEYYCFSKIQLLGQKYWDKTTLASKMQFSCHCFGCQSRHFSLILGYNI